MLSVAVIGSGPSGIYAAESLLKGRPGEVAVDVYDRLPCPYGLVRYGVAPDHLKIKSITRALHKVLEDPAVRFFGNVEVGADITVSELLSHYDAVLYSFGAALDRRLGIPGEDLPGSFSAVEFVSWYCGHPDADISRFALDAESVVVIGAGNVAVDVARLMAKSPAELRATDLPDQVLSVLDASKVRDIHLVARRGPAQAKFTTKELRELGELEGTDVVVDPAVLAPDPASAAAIAEHKEIARNVEVIKEFAERPAPSAARRLHLHFLMAPMALTGEDRVEGIECERTRIDDDGNAVGTGERVVIPAQMVLRSVGYRGGALPGVPLDTRAGVIPNANGRVLRDGEVAQREYVAGWIKRGPTGVIGTNRSDAAETVAALLEDIPAGGGGRDPEPVLGVLASRGVTVVDWDGWLAIDAAEAAAGAAVGRDRIKLARWEELRAAAAAGGTL